MTSEVSSTILFSLAKRPSQAGSDPPPVHFLHSRTHAVHSIRSMYRQRKLEIPSPLCEHRDVARQPALPGLAAEHLDEKSFLLVRVAEVRAVLDVLCRELGDAL